eukprot:121650-Pleurochrysis_carterae.AAC.2
MLIWQDDLACTYVEIQSQRRARDKGAMLARARQQSTCDWRSSRCCSVRRWLCCASSRSAPAARSNAARKLKTFASVAALARRVHSSALTGAFMILSPLWQRHVVKRRQWHQWHEEAREKKSKVLTDATKDCRVQARTKFVNGIDVEKVEIMISVDTLQDNANRMQR